VDAKFRPDIKLSDPMQNGSGNKTLQARQMSIITAHQYFVSFSFTGVKFEKTFDQRDGAKNLYEDLHDGWRIVYTTF